MQDITAFWRIYTVHLENLGRDGIMNNEKRDNKKVNLEVNILGESIVVSGHPSAEYIKAVSDYVNDIMSEIQFNYPRMSRNKIIALGAMNVADELIKANQNVDMYNAEIGQLRKEKDELRKEIEKLQLALEKSDRKAQHYQEQYEELVLLLDEEG